MIQIVAPLFRRSALRFHFFTKDFGEFCGDSIWICIQHIIYQGTRIVIDGVSGMLKPVMPDDAQCCSRGAFDVSYFVLFGIITLNTIVGLIVDSFGALRTKWLPLGHSKMLEADQDHAGKEDVLVRIGKKLTGVGSDLEARRIRWHWPRFGR